MKSINKYLKIMAGTACLILGISLTNEGVKDCIKDNLKKKGG